MPPRKFKKPKLTELKPISDSARYDWAHAREDYINGITDDEGVVRYPKNAEICEKYNIPSQSLSNRINKERWADHRAARQREQSIALHQARLKKMAKKAVIFDETTADAAQVAQKIILERLLELDQIRIRDRVRIQRILDEWDETAPEDVDMDYIKQQIKPLMWSTEIFELAKAMSLFAESGRRALGIKEDETGITMNNNVSIEINSVNSNNVLTSDDETRAAALLQVLRNPNLIIPGLTDKKESIEQVDKPLELESGVVDAEVVDD